MDQEEERPTIMDMCAAILAKLESIDSRLARLGERWS